MPDDKLPHEMAAAINVPGISRHVLLCTESECDADRTAWTQLRRELRERGLRRDVHASEVACLGVCVGGPTAVVYPDGTWYHGMDEHRVVDLVEQHLVGGEVVTDLVTAESPMDDRTG